MASIGSITTNTKRILIVSCILAVIVIVSYLVMTKVAPSTVSSTLCPEDYRTETEKINALADFMGSYMKNNPDATVEQLLTSRYEFLVSHSCNQTLKNMLQDVSTSTPMLRFTNEDFKFEWITFDDGNKVWEVYYPLNGQSSDNFNEELYFNLYPDNVWKKGVVTAKDVADDYIKRADTYIIHKFTAPDPITKNDAYFILSEALYPQDTYTNAYITKISTVKGGAYSVIYVKKITGNESNIEDIVNKWFIQDLKLKDGVSIEIGNISIDPSWISNLSTPNI